MLCAGHHLPPSWCLLHNTADAGMHAVDGPRQLSAALQEPHLHQQPPSGQLVQHMGSSQPSLLPPLQLKQEPHQTMQQPTMWNVNPNDAAVPSAAAARPAARNSDPVMSDSGSDEGGGAAQASPAAAGAGVPLPLRPCCSSWMVTVQHGHA
jgi:hypothetical protein